MEIPNGMNGVDRSHPSQNGDTQNNLQEIMQMKLEADLGNLQVSFPCQEDTETHDTSCQTEETPRRTDPILHEPLLKKISERLCQKKEDCNQAELGSKIPCFRGVSSRQYRRELTRCPPSKPKTAHSENQKQCGLCKMLVSDVKNLPCGHPLCVPCCRLCSGDLRSFRCSLCTSQSIASHPSQQEINGKQMDDDENDSAEMAKNVHTGYCSTHQGQPIRFYCADCCLAVCISCADQSHAAHAICRLEQSLELQRNALSSLQHSLMTKIEHHRRQMSLVCELLSRLHANWTDQSQRVHQACDFLAQTVQSRRCQLLSDLQRCYVNKTEKFKSQVETLQTTLIELEACQNFVDHTLQAGDSTQMIQLSRQVAMRVRADPGAPGTSGTPVIPCCPQADQLHFKFVDDSLSELNRCIADFGSVSDKQEVAVNSAARNQTQFPAKYEREEELGLRSESVSSFQSECFASNSKSDYIDGAEGQFVDIDGSTSASLITTNRSCRNTTECSVDRDLTSGRCPPSRLLLLPRRATISSPGAHSVDGRSSRASRTSRASRLSLTSTRSSRTSSGRSAVSEGSLAPGALTSIGGMTSPSTPATPMTCCFFVEEDDLVRSIGSRGRGKGQFSNPQGIAYCSGNDRLLVADSNNQCVQVFSLEGSCRLRFGVRGRRPGQMQRPCGVAASPGGHYAVTDYEARCVNLHDQNGNYVKRFGVGKLQGPKGVASDWRGHLLVVDNRGCCVVTFSAAGRLLSRFGCRGSAQHQLAGPHFVAVDSHSRIVVTDFHNHAVKVFSSEGRFLLSFGGHGEEDGCFNAPTGVAVDERDNILVADWGNSRIQVFDSQGRYMSRVNSAASSLYGPQSLCMSPEGHVMVADSGNHAVKIYSYSTVE